MYTVIIKKVTREQVKSREWKITGKQEDGDNKYGYIETETTEDVERPIYTQIAEELDLEAVIKAVNEIE